MRCLGAGGMGSLYEVVHQRTKKRAALKVMKPELIESRELKERFKQETMLTASLDSDHVVSVFDGGVDVTTGAPYLVMELLTGWDLHRELVRLKRLPRADVVEYLRQSAYGLSKAHDAGIVHRDLKPENLFLTRRDDGSPCVKVLDFGIAKIVAESMSRANTTRSIGTPVYMAPEQIRGEGTIGPAADLYALAHVAFTLLCGMPYWTIEYASTKSLFALLRAIELGPKEPPSARARARGVELPASFDAWFQKASANDPLDRHDDAVELVGALQAAFDRDETPPTQRDLGGSA